MEKVHDFVMARTHDLRQQRHGTQYDITPTQRTERQFTSDERVHQYTFFLKQAHQAWLSCG